MKQGFSMKRFAIKFNPEKKYLFLSLKSNSAQAI